jgi:hypothetical protein
MGRESSPALEVTDAHRTATVPGTRAGRHGAHLRVEGTNDAIGRGSIWRIPVMRRAAEIGVGVGEARHIRIVGLPIGLEERLRVEMA